jgi:8-oxo-dGTP pyrophosphatase MutT (NUDIX family)
MFLSSAGWRELLEEAGLEVRSLHTWNYIYASRKVSPITMGIWNTVARFVPKHGSLHFVYVCSVARAG